jgi:hypothetical protein
VSGITRNGLPAITDFSVRSRERFAVVVGGSLETRSGAASAASLALAANVKCKQENADVAPCRWSGTPSRVAEGLAGKWRSGGRLCL